MADTNRNGASHLRALVDSCTKNFTRATGRIKEIWVRYGARSTGIHEVHIGETPYGFIGRFQAFNGSGKDVQALAGELFDCYRKHGRVRRKMAEVFVGLL